MVRSAPVQPRHTLDDRRLYATDIENQRIGCPLPHGRQHLQDGRHRRGQDDSPGAGKRRHKRVRDTSTWPSACAARRVSGSGSKPRTARASATQRGRQRRSDEAQTDDGKVVLLQSVRPTAAARGRN